MLGDDALLAAQRLAEWASRAPTMEEDVALANIALDQLGAARLFLSLAGDEDELAYRRDDLQFRNCQLVELPNGPARTDLDFGWTIAKLLFLSAAQRQTYEVLAADGGPLGEIAAKTVKESAYHLDHASLWTRRLGDGTPESHRRMTEAVQRLWAYTFDLTVDRVAWLGVIEPVLAEAGLARPADPDPKLGGRVGRHTEHLSYLLAEMQVLHRAHPGATW
ncbi:MAG: phenylacetate-CoA oxygenase subunit PaaC [Hamadaea sp.]|uniref:1,2-phenylacetyl-CoA epoxidase subunit PaaC n=1 Tax=Hamadaea sp. TaxID=2024425 RepID=UPI00185F050D|nr:1,2-phenylacetyl-CoA epoxidase subunit PaaC [Hamadaea sp.]NUR72029.1 phenylacetate-CoA oxygenase subunit PaaC [Hamadaea sp.]NUT17579.1 phenylacetate-CoA oxygenase subunit PaaC [Hamadaea sp.]